jgi:Na+/proline symporter
VGLFFIVMMSIQILVGIVAFPSAMGISAAGKTEMEGRVGYTVGTYIKRLCTVAWCLTALAAVAWYLSRGIDLATVHPDNVYGDVARAFLPGVMPGLLGLFLASLLAAVMSSCDSFMIAASGLFTQNLYQPLRPNRPAGHYVFVGRLMGLVIVAGGLAFAYWVSDVIKGVEIWFQINPMMGIAFWVGLLWRGMTPAGAWASTLVGFGTWWLATRELVVEWAARLPFSEPLRLVWVEDGVASIYKPWEILAYMVAATLAGIVVSLLTRPVDKERLDRYYALTRTPIQKGEVIEKPCAFPPGVEPASREMLVTAGGLEIPKPSRNSVLGFLGGCVAVVVLIAGFVLLMEM